MLDLKLELINWYEIKDSEIYVLTTNNNIHETVAMVNLYYTTTEQDYITSDNELLLCDKDNNGFIDMVGDFISIKQVMNDLDKEQLEYIAETLSYRPIIISKNLYEQIIFNNKEAV